MRQLHSWLYSEFEIDNSALYFVPPQMANVAPLLYTLASWKWPQQTFETPVIYIIITLGAVSCLLLSMLWDVTSEIAGAQRSTALLVLQFFLALVDCTSSVAFLPFMFMLKAQYMTAYFIGEGFSGLVPSLVALGQGAGSMKCVSVMASSASDMNRSQTNQTLPLYNENNSFPELLSSPHIPSPSPIVVPSSPDTTQATALHIYPQFQEPRFSVSAFFLILMVFLVISNISFTLLRYWGYCKKEYADQEEDFVEDASESPMLKNDEKSSFTDSKCCKMISAVDEYKGKTINEIKEDLERRRNGSKNDSFYGYEVFENKKFSPISDVLNHSQSSGAFERGSSSGSSYCEELSKRALITRTKFALFLILTAWLNALSNGVLPSIQTYSCLPYGIKPYHLSVTLAAIANPVACFAASFVKISSVVSTLLMTSMGSALAGYIIYTAAASPDPPLVGMVAGTTVLVSLVF